MSTYKCTDCGEEYDCTLEACPNCGCPSEYQTGQTGQTSTPREPSQDKSQKAERIPNRKRHIVLPILLFFVAGIIVVGILYYQEHSYEIKMARFKRQATKYESSLDANSYLLSETIDSITQKVFYYVRENRSDNKYGAPIKDIMVYDLSTGETESIQLTSVDIEDYDFCGIELKDSKQIADRLFIIIHSNCTWKFGATGVFYVNVRNNSLHYVESCNDAEFAGVDEIRIHKYYKTSYYEEKTEHKYYNLSTKLNDEAYAANRKEQKATEERLSKKEQVAEIKRWLLGTWEISNYDEWLGRYTAYVCITENKLRCGSNGQDFYNGPYEIDTDACKIIFDRHDGYYAHLVFYPGMEKLSDGEGGFFTKVSQSVRNDNSNGYRGSSQNFNNRSAVQFRCDSDVISYTSSHYFKNSVGNKIKINFQGMYVNNNLLTNAPRVLYYSASTAIISVSSPYMGGGTMIINVDASSGTITDESGDVFRIVN